MDSPHPRSGPAAPVAVTPYADPSAFAARVAPLVARYPVEANVLATRLELELARPGEPSSTRWWTLDEGGSEPSGAAMLTEYGLFLTPAAPGGPEALAAGLAAAGTRMRSFSGTLAETAAFAAAWRHLTGARAAVVQSTRMYATAEVTAPDDVPGRAVVLGPDDDLTTVGAWYADFHAETHPGLGLPGDPEQQMRDRTARGWVVLWEDAGVPVSTAAVWQPAGGVSRVGPVYTPPIHRRRGYAAAVTAHASRLALAAGAGRCMLYTDLSNPTSNSVYQRLGYRPVADAALYDAQGAD